MSPILLIMWTAFQRFILRDNELSHKKYNHCVNNDLPNTFSDEINNQSIIPSTVVIQLSLTLKMTTAQVVQTSVTVNNNSPIQDYVHPDDQTQPFDYYYYYYVAV